MLGFRRAAERMRCKHGARLREAPRAHAERRTLSTRARRTSPGPPWRAVRSPTSAASVCKDPPGQGGNTTRNHNPWSCCRAGALDRTITSGLAGRAGEAGLDNPDPTHIATGLGRTTRPLLRSHGRPVARARLAQRWRSHCARLPPRETKDAKQASKQALQSKRASKAPLDATRPTQGLW